MNKRISPFYYSNYVNAVVLTAGVPKVVTVPSDAHHVVFSATGDFYVRFAAAAAIPVADVTDGTGSMLNPEYRDIDLVTTFGIVSPTDCTVTFEYYTW